MSRLYADLTAKPGLLRDNARQRVRQSRGPIDRPKFGGRAARVVFKSRQTVPPADREIPDGPGSPADGVHGGTGHTERGLPRCD
jgi:hypothetical protein